MTAQTEGADRPLHNKAIGESEGFPGRCQKQRYHYDRRHSGRSARFLVRPTIVRDIEDGARLVDEEQFGPVLPIIHFDDPEDALARANASLMGLGGSIWSNDRAALSSWTGLQRGKPMPLLLTYFPTTML